MKKQNIRIKNYILLAITIFVVFSAVGMVLEYVIFKDSNLQDTIIIDKNMKWYTVFTNNLFVCLFMMTGLFTFGVTTFLSLIFNSVLFGMSIVTSVLSGVTWTEVMMAVLPHGIVEIPAIILSATVGFLGFTFYDRDKGKCFVFHLGKMMAAVTLMLAIASVLETTVTVPVQ